MVAPADFKFDMFEVKPFRSLWLRFVLFPLNILYLHHTFYLDSCECLKLLTKKGNWNFQIFSRTHLYNKRLVYLQIFCEKTKTDHPPVFPYPYYQLFFAQPNPRDCFVLRYGQFGFIRHCKSLITLFVTNRGNIIYGRKQRRLCKHHKRRMLP